MAITEEERKQYSDFLTGAVKELKSLDVNLEETIWHYTTGNALLSIIESGTLYSTQVSCLNDSTEIRYATKVLRDAFFDLQAKGSLPAEETRFLGEIIRNIEEEPAIPIHIPSAWFVTCFSKQKDDLSQWRAYSGGENGYAIGFIAGGFFGRGSLLVHVNYDRVLHKGLAERIAVATLRYFREGLDRRGGGMGEAWGQEFLSEWDEMLSYLAPMVKDPAFSGENEYRVVHQLQVSELSQLRFRQKQNLMSRHLPLAFPPPNVATASQLLPIMEVMVGPGRYKEISRTSVDTVLRQKGYVSVPVSMSEIPFQST